MRLIMNFKHVKYSKKRERGVMLCEHFLNY